MNESKFGHGLSECDISLTLLRSPNWPDPECDMGKHSFKYALMSHSGSLSTSDVLKESIFFNNPCVAVPVEKASGNLPATFYAVKAESEKLVIDTVKPAEDGQGTVIRMYDGKKTRGVENVVLGIKANTAYLCDMLENELEELEIEEGKIRVPFKPFEIITIKVK
jgi:alpha-mannosidase